MTIFIVLSYAVVALQEFIHITMMQYTPTGGRWRKRFWSQPYKSTRSPPIGGEAKCHATKIRPKAV